MNAVASIRLPCWAKDGVWLGELQISDRRGEATLETDDTTGRISIAELADYVVLLRNAAPFVACFAAPVSVGRVEGDGELFGFLGSQAGLGRLRVALCSPKGDKIWQHPLWIRPAKFRDIVDFETMLSDICDWRTSLALDLRSATSAPWILDRTVSSTPPEERLVVLRAAAERHQLVNALRYVERNSSRRLERDASVGRLGEATIDVHRLGHHLASPSRRVAVPAGHRLANRVSSLPMDMPMTRRFESVDTPENRFAKFTAVVFRNQIVDAMRAGINPDTPLGSWATSNASIFDRLLGGAFYRSVGALGRVDIGSPVLQRRRGYRSILEAFLAARSGLAIRWDELDEFVDAETRDVPSLYEIWCLLKLRTAVQTEFGVRLTDEPMRYRSGGLSLARGTVASADGFVEIAGRRFALRLWYNRSFAPISESQTDGRWTISEPLTGTWTKTMRPDFTIELREATSDADIAADKNSILIHFDAKYRIKSIGMNNSQDDVKTYAADDIDKMHAYLFGITNSVGAYIMYPGDKRSYFRRSNLRSTIGAIPAVPGKTTHLDKCLREILEVAVQDA